MNDHNAHYVLWLQQRLEKLEHVISKLQQLMALKDEVIGKYKDISIITVRSYDAGKFKKEVLPTLRRMIK